MFKKEKEKKDHIYYWAENEQQGVNKGTWRYAYGTLWSLYIPIKGKE